MKRIYMIIIVIILLLLAGLYINSPYSPLNKINVNGETMKMSSGYTVQESSSNRVTIDNKTNTLIISSTKYSDIQEAINVYNESIDNIYTLSSTDISSDNEQIIQTEAKSDNTTITRYWFTKNNVVYNIQTENPVADTSNVVKKMVSSMN